MIEYMFYVPLYQYQVKEWDVKKKQLLNLYEKICNEFVEGDNLTTNFHSQSFQTTEGIHQIFTQEIEDFLCDIQCQKSSLTYAWFEKANSGGFHGVHNHGPFGYSSVCFINYNEKEHTPTKFLCPFNNFLTGRNLIHIPTHIVEGSLIFFPSMITHFTDPNTSNDERLIVSFNLDIE
jgi:hypothetical protein